MTAPLPKSDQVPAITAEEEAARTLHDIANLVTSMLAASAEAAIDIDQAVQTEPGDPEVRQLLGAAQQSLFYLEHAGRLAAHVLGARPLVPHQNTSPATRIGSGLQADLPVVLDLAARSARPIVRRGCPIRIEALAMPPVVGDDRELAMVFFNLFINAHDAMRGKIGGFIDVCCYDVRDRVVVEVRDGGPGMTQEQMTNAFRPGYSPRGSRGLGLAICRDIVERYGGNIQFANADGLIVRVNLRAA